MKDGLTDNELKRIKNVFKIEKLEDLDLIKGHSAIADLNQRLFDLVTQHKINNNEIIENILVLNAYMLLLSSIGINNMDVNPKNMKFFNRKMEELAKLTSDE